MPIIYKSNFFLHYSSKRITEKYLNLIEPIVKLGNRIIIPALTVISLSLFILIAVMHVTLTSIDRSEIKVFFIVILVFFVIFFVFDVILFILVYISSTSRKSQRVIATITYILITFHFILIQIMMESLFKIKYEYCYWLNVIEYIIKINMHFVGIVEFHQLFYFHIIVPIVTMGVFFEISGIKTILFDSGITFIILNIGLIISSHLITRIRKRNFYYFFMLNITNTQRENILNNLNTGFLRVEDDKIEFVNTSLKNILLKSKYVKEHNKEREVEGNNSEVIFDILFQWTIQQTTNLSDEHLNILNPINTYEGTRLKIKQMFKQNEIVNKDSCQFVFFSYSSVDLDDNKSSSLNVNEQTESNTKITYEIFCNYDNGNQFEFIFNDITRTKEAERKENDIKIQSVFLTKVAHEFKNPLICIQELSTQIKEKIFLLFNLSADNKNDMGRNCSIIVSIVEYLLIRIKDLDYFISTETEVSGSCQTIFEKIELKKIISFCIDIAHAKLKQNNKEEVVKLNTVLSDELPKYIYSDGIKIKQILSQLISNAVKYTEVGVLSIEIEKDLTNSNLNFVIKDTGKGLNSEVEQFLSDKEGSVSIYVGLHLIKKLTRQLGQEIQYVTQKDSGTTFWFTISLKEDNERNQLKCLKTFDDSNSLNKTLKIDFLQLEISNPFSDGMMYNIICADDEELACKALIRVMKDTAKAMNIKLNVIEANDGTEILNLIYNHYYTKDNEPIHAIISDQKMNFLNGSLTQNILTNLTNMNKRIPFFIVTAFNNNARYFIETKCNAIYTKPLKKCDAKMIIDSILKSIVV